ncbi:macoilin-like isoform X1 [Leptotrombidium deliense]|uniref:Macoilin n=1 Tax=Leptotrombidium deliense TaxID=299467 RepID=A0A443SED4_9ACAR|nr:macoilin-like isoform X1 [Leptotrombidium deliense]
MKRRNADFGKPRRLAKKNKITEGLYGSTTFIYVKFLLVWALVLFADFILEFRFEYLWPFWLLLRSVYDSFKYQGLAFSVFFVFIALTSDMICFLFIPVHWLFFAASTYVWVQYVWHTERGICLPTVSFWLLFVYIEASIRLKDIKSLPFHLDLCRPFAAHCIGYPVVTLGFGFKSYVSYKMRLRKQKEVAKENEFYIELLQKALPQESTSSVVCATETKETVISNGHTAPNHNHNHINKKANDKSLAIISVNSNSIKLNTEYDAKKLTQNGIDKHELQYMEHQIIKRISSVNDFDEDNENGECNNHKNTFKSISMSLSSSKTTSQTPNSTPVSTSPQPTKWNHTTSNHVNSCLTNSITGGSITNNSSNKKTKNMVANNLTPPKDDHILRLEADIKRLKADLQASRQCELELRGQITSLRAENSQLLQDNENLQTKLHNLVTARQQDKQNVTQLEKKLIEEKKLKLGLETQLMAERKAKKAEEAATARAVAIATAARGECTETCKIKRRELENDLKQLRRELKLREDQLRQIDREAQSLRQYKDSLGDTEILMSALSAMQDKTAQLETSLSAETRLKLDLFSALGDTKRQLEISQALLAQKDKEIDELKLKITEVMAVMPPTTNSSFVSLENSLVSSILYNSKYLKDQSTNSAEAFGKSGLDPNASVYTPKCDL